MPNVKVYSTPTCPYCIRAKDYLKNKNIAFQNIDVSEDPEAAEEMVRISGQMGVPVIVIDDQVVIGFDKARINSLLKIS